MEPIRPLGDGTNPLAAGSSRDHSAQRWQLSDQMVGRQFADWGSGRGRGDCFYPGDHLGDPPLFGGLVGYQPPIPRARAAAATSLPCSISGSIRYFYCFRWWLVWAGCSAASRLYLRPRSRRAWHRRRHRRFSLRRGAGARPNTPHQAGGLGPHHWVWREWWPRRAHGSDFCRVRLAAGTRLGLSVADRRIALAAGIGAGIGAIFRAPLGGALIGAEILYTQDFEIDVIIPALIASIIGYAIYGAWAGWDADLWQSGAKCLQ